MGNNLFNADIAGALAKAMGTGGPAPLLKVTLKKKTPGTRSTTDPNAGISSTTRSFTGAGILETYTDKEREGTSILEGDRRVLVLGDTLPRGIVPSCTTCSPSRAETGQS